MQKQGKQDERLNLYGYLNDDPEFQLSDRYRPEEFLRVNFISFAEKLPHTHQNPPQILFMKEPPTAENAVRGLTFFGPQAPVAKNCLIIYPDTMRILVQDIWNLDDFWTLIMLWRMLGRFLRLFVLANGKFQTTEMFTLEQERSIIEAAPSLENFFREEPEHSINLKPGAQDDVHINSSLFVGVLLGSFNGDTFSATLARKVLTHKRPEFEKNPEQWLQWLRMIEGKFF